MSVIWMNFGDPRLPERFWAMVVPCPISGCWIHVGRVVSGGYTQTAHHGKRIVSHRLTFIIAGGELPAYGAEDVELDHRCNTPSCCNPAHVRPMTHRENSLRGDTIPARNAVATECIRGHAFDEKNTRIVARRDGSHYRHCRQCARDRRTRAQTEIVI